MIDNSDNQINRMMKFDGLHTARQITGEKDSPETMLTGMMLEASKADTLKRLLKRNNDVFYNCSLEHYLAIAVDMGFKICLEEDFTTNKGLRETLFLMWHDELSILLKFYSFRWSENDKRITSGQVIYYNCAFQDSENFSKYTGSGSYIHHSYGECYWNADNQPTFLIDLHNKKPVYHPGMEEDYVTVFLPKYRAWKEEIKQTMIEKNIWYVWSGYHDGGEALRHSISMLKMHGRFLKQWIKSPLLQLGYYQEDELTGISAEKTTLNRLAKLPKYIQDCIQYESRDTYHS